MAGGSTSGGDHSSNNHQPRTLPGDSHHAPPDTIPIDLIAEILARLPVKSLLRFRCVCKSWNALISDPQFVKNQLRASASDPNRHHLIVTLLNPPDDLVLIDYSVPSLFNSTRATSTLPACPDILKNRFHNLAGSCHGMLCIATRRSGVFVWNPSTGKVKTLPSFGNASDYTKFGFGYDHFADCYKVVAVVFHARLAGATLVFKIDAMVHNLGTDSWRAIQGFPVMKSPFSHWGIFVCGTLNWLGTDETRPLWVIVSFDLGMETFQRLSPPDCVAASSEFAWTIGALKGCLCVLVDCNIVSDVWVMKEYGNKESWTKLISVPFTLGGFPSEYQYYKTRPLCISDEDDAILLQFGSKSIVYNSKNGSFSTVGIQSVTGPLIAEVYAESLISPCC